MLSRAVSSATQSRRAPRAWRALAARPTLSAALLYALLSLLFVAPGLLPGKSLSASDYLWAAAPWTAERPAGVKGVGSNYEEADAVLQFQPFTQYARAHLPDVPLWNPHQMAGRPFVANSQSALFSPFTWPSLLLPFWWSLGLVAALKLFCAAFGTFLLARALAIRWSGALLAGLVYAFGLFFVVWLSWPLSSVWAWLPWLLLGVHHVVHRRGAVPIVALAVIVALQYFGGHPESSFHVLAVGSFFALLALSRVPGPERLPAIGRLVAALLAGSALAAVALIPFLELLRHSGDLETREAKVGGHHSVSTLIAYFMPAYWGRPSKVPTEAFTFAQAYYAGALPLVLGVWALVARRTRERVAVAAVGVVAIGVVVGVPGLFQLVTAVPGFNHAYNQRLVIVALLALALLAGWGLGDLLDRPRAPRVLMVLAATLWLVPVVIVVARLDLGSLGDAFQVAWGLADPTTGNAATVVPLAAAWVWLVFGGLALLCLWLRARMAATAFTALAVAFVVVDLFRAGIGLNPAIPTDHAEQPVTPAIERLRAARPSRFVGLGPEVGVQAMPPNTAMRYGLYDARGYDFPIERRFNRLWRSQIADRFEGFAPETITATTSPGALRMMGLLSVADIVDTPGQPPITGLKATYKGPDAVIYANPEAMPRAWIVGAQRVVEGEDAQLAAVTDPAFDPRREAIVGAPVEGLDGGGGTAKVTRIEPDRMEVTASGRGLVVMSDVHFPGWHATVDGRDADIERVDYLLRGVAVGDGEHEIVLEYRPSSWRAGWIVSLLTALGLLAAMWKGAWRWRS